MIILVWFYIYSIELYIICFTSSVNMNSTWCKQGFSFINIKSIKINVELFAISIAISFYKACNSKINIVYSVKKQAGKSGSLICNNNIARIASKRDWKFILLPSNLFFLIFRAIEYIFRYSESTVWVSIRSSQWSVFTWCCNPQNLSLLDF